jgi:hypothetical protein
MDRALAVDPRLLWNLFGKTKDASIARLVSALFLIAAASSVIQQIHKKQEPWKKKQF